MKTATKQVATVPVKVAGRRPAGAKPELPVEVECELCQGVFTLARRRLRELRQFEEPVRCRTCQIIAKLELTPAPDVSQYYGFWFQAFPGDQLDDLLADLFGERAASSEACLLRAELRERTTMATAA